MRPKFKYYAEISNVSSCRAALWYASATRRFCLFCWRGDDAGAGGDF